MCYYSNIKETFYNILRDISTVKVSGSSDTGVSPLALLSKTELISGQRCKHIKDSQTLQYYFKNLKPSNLIKTLREYCYNSG